MADHQHDHTHPHDHSHDHSHDSAPSALAWDGVTVPASGGAPGTTVAWFHCFSGIAGDMALGALLDAGADLDEVRALLARLPVSGWSLETETVMRSGIGGTKVHVRTEASPPHRRASDVVAIVAEAGLPDRVHRRALATFRALAEAEGHLHRQPPETVHFHEVGALDAIVDVVGTCAALEVLGVDEVASSPVADGLGTVRAAHGELPVPVPAVVSLLAGAPTYGLPIARELTTPTGAALLAANVVQWGPMPAMTITASGFGAGTAELDERPNLTQVVLGTRTAADGSVAEGQPVVALEANVDDVTGEVLAHTIARLLDAGAHDAWVTPIVMKKGRPAHTVHVLADPALAPVLRDLLVAETGTLGVRASTMQRWPQAREVHTVEVDGQTVRVKVSGSRAKAEHDDVAAAARALGRPLRDVARRAEQVWADDHRN
ncbi:nickel pincer cofactor biosynthesis protein LarC [Rhabdothermincola salaria]|uniref:nickel pincer cofactor biosynthesis protein LarC n=1 Tax=Rhabdothermincola salaria TaxID=2903142 RepID=UPI001E5A9117|nr:nickel pincer cofactor biosynthesis protein LarC [Rhabdothermincola salaria]